MKGEGGDNLDSYFKRNSIREWMDHMDTSFLHG